MSVQSAFRVRGDLTRNTDPIVFSTVGGTFSFRPRRWQALVWISVTIRDAHKRSLALGEEKPAVFPALMDTGCNESLFLHQWHIEKWLGFPMARFANANKPQTILGHTCPKVLSDLWLHPDSRRPFQGELNDARKLSLSDGATVSAIRVSDAFRFNPPESRNELGIRNLWRRIWGTNSDKKSDVVYHWGKNQFDHRSDGVPYDVFPRIPLIGMRTLATNHLTFKVDGRDGAFEIDRSQALRA